MPFALIYQVSYDPSPLPYVAIAAITGILVVLFYRRHRGGRSDAFRKLAAKRGLQWLATTLPGNFPRRLLDDLYCGWAVPRWSHPHNVIGGNVGRDFLLAFDITVAKGESSYRRTIVARRSAIPGAKVSVGKGYVYRCIGEWHIATPESTVMVMPRLIDPGTIDKLWEQLR